LGYLLKRGADVNAAISDRTAWLFFLRGWARRRFGKLGGLKRRLEPNPAALLAPDNSNNVSSRFIGGLDEGPDRDTSNHGPNSIFQTSESISVVDATYWTVAKMLLEHGASTSAICCVLFESAHKKHESSCFPVDKLLISCVPKRYLPELKDVLQRCLSLNQWEQLILYWPARQDDHRLD
jgi:hypothetical protein